MSAPKPTDHPRPWLCALALLALALATFAGSLWSPFLYDSELQIETWDYLHRPSNFAEVLTLRVLARDVLDFNRPVQLASLMLDALLYGKNPFGYHLTSILLHAACGMMVFALARAAGRAAGRPVPPLAALLGAALFVVHPVQVEAVCEPGFREDLLATLFGSVALWVVLRAGPHRLWRDAVAAALCAFLAVAAKEVAVCVPFVIALALLLFPAGGEGKRRWVLALLPALACGLFLALRFALATKNSAIFSSKPVYPGDSFAAMLGISPRIMATYLQNFFWPTHLSADYGVVNIGHMPLGLALWLLGLATAAVGAWVWRDRRVALGVGLACLALLPVSNLLPIYRPMADRYLYFPMVGAGLILACALGLASSRRWVAAALHAAAVAALMALLSLSRSRQEVWSGEFALWSETARATPTSYNASLGLAWALYNRSDMESALKWFERAHQLGRGKNGDPATGAALALERMRRFEEADRLYEKALEIKPGLADPRELVARLQWETDDAEWLAGFQKRHAARGNAERKMGNEE